VATRFVQLFNEHGVETSQIPRVFPDVTLGDLSVPSSLVTALTPEVIDRAAYMFGVQRDWLEGVSDEVYEPLNTYKEPARLLVHLKAYAQPGESLLLAPLRVVTVNRNLDGGSVAYQPLIPILLEPVMTIGEDTIWRYHVYREGFDWGYAQTRIELKVIARLVYRRLNTPIPLFQVTDAQMEDLLEGRLIPGKFLRGCLLTEPSLEDFATSQQENCKARETDELPLVLKYIADNDLTEFSFAKATPVNETDDVSSAPAVSEEPSPDAIPKNDEKAIREPTLPKTGKRAELAEVWKAIRVAASVLWAQDQSISIEDMIVILKKKSVLKASGFSNSATRKHIADLAPEGIRGKSGRKPKKST